MGTDDSEPLLSKPGNSSAQQAVITLHQRLYKSR